MPALPSINSNGSPNWRLHLGVLGAVVVIGAASWFITPQFPPLDDGYIALDSAQGVIAGSDAQYGSAPLTGVTSPPYVLLIIVLLKLGLAPLITVRLATAMGLAAFVIALWLLARSAGIRGYGQCVLPIAVLVSGPVSRQATNGVETGWAMSTAVALMAACFANRPIAAAAMVGVLPWLRPDLLPMAGLLFLTSLWNQSQPVRIRAVVVASLVFIPWAVWLHSQTGHPIPQTMSAKAAFFAEGCHPLSARMLMVGWALVTWLVSFFPAALVAAAWLPRSAVGRVGLLAAAAIVAVYAAVLPTGLWHNNQRYMYPVAVPLLAVGLAAVAQSRRGGWRTVMLIATAISIFLWPVRHWSDESTDREAVANWVVEHIAPDAKLLVQDAGVLAVLTPNPLVDLVGLKTPSSIVAHQTWTQPTCGRDRSIALAAITGASGAQYFIVTTEWDRLFQLTSGLREQGISLQELRSTPAGQFGYNVYRIVPTVSPK